MTTRARWNGSVAVVVGLVAVLLAQAASAEVVYFVSGTSADDGLKTHLANDLGHTVIPRTGSTGNYADAVVQGADLIIISSSIGSSQASGKGFHTSRIPILNFEPHSYDDFGWTGSTANVDYGDSQTARDTLRIDDASHPITNGFATGPVTVLADAAADSRFSFGVPHADADVLTTYQGGGTGNGKATIYVYERGDTLKQGTNPNGFAGDTVGVTQARSRYTGFFLDYGVGVPDLYAKMNANGVQLFDQAVGHALDTRRAYWTFDSDMTDAVGDNDGTAVNGASITHTEHNPYLGSGALSLSGSAQYVTVDGLAGELETGDEMTLTMWFNTQSAGSTPAGHQLFSAHTTTGGNILRLGTGPNGEIFLNPTNVGGYTHDKMAGSGYNDGAWHFLTVSVLDTDVQVTLDNVPLGEGVFSSAAGNPAWSTASLFSFGQEYDGGATPGDYFDGYIDDVMIWGRVLSQGEIQSLYLDGIPEPTSLALLGLGAVALARRRRR